MLRSNVILQMAGQNEGSIARRTFVWFDVVVAFHVSSQVTGRHKRYTAQRTFIRLFLLMYSHMNGHIVRLIERFPAQSGIETRTKLINVKGQCHRCVSLLSNFKTGVDPHKPALERLFTGMRSHVCR